METKEARAVTDVSLFYLAGERPDVPEHQKLAADRRLVHWQKCEPGLFPDLRAPVR